MYRFCICDTTYLDIARSWRDLEPIWLPRLEDGAEHDWNGREQEELKTLCRDVCTIKKKTFPLSNIQFSNRE